MFVIWILKIMIRSILKKCNLIQNMKVYIKTNYAQKDLVQSSKDSKDVCLSLLNSP